jgi:Cdc6-like AAA superfamily ATPase
MSIPSLQALTPNTFVGRNKLTSKICERVLSGAEKRLIITGEPGIGKTALAKHLSDGIPTAASHYCSSRQNASIEPLAFVRSISSQLSKSLDGFASDIMQTHSDIKIASLSG